MAPYLILGVVVTFLAAISHRVSQKYSVKALPQRREHAVAPAQRWTFFDLIAVTALIAFSGLRHDVGTDYPVYELVFNKLDASDWSASLADSTQEVGYTLLMLLTKQATDDAQAIFWIAAILTVVPVYIAIKRLTLDPGFAVALYFAFEYAPSFNAVRQYMAAAILFLAWTYLGKKNIVFWVLALVAVSFHMTALMAVVVLVFARRLNPSLRTATVFLLGAVLVAGIMNQVPALGALLEGVNPRYADYLDSGHTGIGAYLQVLAYGALLVYALNVGRRNTPLTDTDRQLGVFILAGIALMIVGTQAIVMFRLASYFTIFIVLLVPNRISRTRDRIVSTFLILAAVAGYFIMDIANYGEVVPYETYVAF